MAKQAQKKQPAEKTRNRIKEFKYLDASLLDKHPDNFRIHSPSQRNAMQEIIDHVGIAGAAIVREIPDGRYQILDGHMRSELLEGEIPCIVLDVDDKEAKLVLATYDAVGDLAETDEEAIDRLVRDTIEEIPEADRLLRKIIVSDAGAVLDKDEKPAEFVAPKDPPKYPLAPELDEGYHAAIVFCRTESDWRKLRLEMDLPTVEAKGQVKRHCRVIHVDHFWERFDLKPEHREKLSGQAGQ